MIAAVRLMPFALAAGCATAAQAVGPSLDEFTRMTRAYCPQQQVEIRKLACEGYEEEPTEFTCRYQAKTSGGAWTDHADTVAIDGAAWILLSTHPDYCSSTKSS